MEAWDRFLISLWRGIIMADIDRTDKYPGLGGGNGRPGSGQKSDGFQKGPGPGKLGEKEPMEDKRDMK
jgi:hypothetical protein